MLRELRGSQRDGNLRRRWFADKDLDLFVWITEDSIIESFQLCHRHASSEYAFTWTKADGCRHDMIDDGEETAARSHAPILLPCAEVLADTLLERFIESSIDVDPVIRRVVEKHLRTAAGYASRRATFGATRVVGEDLS
jgi:hypothetical protein